MNGHFDAAIFMVLLAIWFRLCPEGRMTGSQTVSIVCAGIALGVFIANAVNA